jgi:hypothetical protein
LNAQALPRGNGVIEILRCNAINQNSRAQALAAFPTVQQTTCLNQNTTQYHLEHEIENRHARFRATRKCCDETSLLACSRAAAF